jgi:hypothetical protein
MLAALMNSPDAPLRTRRPWSRLLALLPALLLLCGVLAVALHHHDPAHSRDSCAVCTSAHLPAHAPTRAPAVVAPEHSRGFAPVAAATAPGDEPARVANTRGPPRA